MLRLEGFMEIQQLHHDGVSVSEIARRLNLDRKTVRKYLRQVSLATWLGFIRIFGDSFQRGRLDVDKE
jgi:DNA-binding transcriptional regulator LsrR (DeoR family)